MKRSLFFILAVFFMAFIIPCNSVNCQINAAASFNTKAQDSDYVNDNEDSSNNFLTYEKMSEEEITARKECGYWPLIHNGKIGYNNFAFGYPPSTQGAGYDSSDYVFYDVTYMTEEPISVFMDSVSSIGPFSTSDIYNDYSIVFTAVDEYATEKNGGLPVLFLYVTGGPENTGFFTYNMATRKITKLCLCGTMINDPHSIGIYGDRIYYVYNDGDKGDVLCSMKFDGSDMKTYNNESEMQMYLLAANDEYVFFQNYLSGMIYRSDLNFENTVEFAHSLSSTGDIYDGYLYYLDDRDNVDEIDGNRIVTGNLVRKLLTSTINDPDEIIYKSPYNYFIRNGKMYTLKYSPTYYGGKLSYTENTILEVDLDTLETRTVFEYTERDDVIMRVETVTDDVFMLEFQVFKDGNVVSEEGTIYVKYFDAHYNMSTGIYTEVEFPQG